MALAPDGTRYVAWQNSSGVAGSDIYVRRQPGSAVTHTISGHVRDRQGDPVPGTLVAARGGGSATTDSQGAFTITGVMTGTYTLTPVKSDWAFCPIQRTVSVPPNAEAQDFTGCSAEIAPEVVDFLTDSRVQIAHVSNAASDASVVGDYFLDKQAADAVQGVLNLVLDTVSLAGVNWKLVGPGLKHITTPGYKAALDASWRGWVAASERCTPPFSCSSSPSLAQPRPSPRMPRSQASSTPAAPGCSSSCSPSGPSTRSRISPDGR